MKKWLLIALVVSCFKSFKSIEFKNKDVNGDLVVALINSEIDKAIELINQGANVNDRNSNGFISLMIASQNGYIDIVKLSFKKRC